MQQKLQMPLHYEERTKYVYLAKRQINIFIVKVT